MRGTPTRLPYWPQARRPIDFAPSRSSLVSWSLSKDSATAQRAPPFQVFGRSRRPARTWLTILRHCSSGHCQGSSGDFASSIGTSSVTARVASRPRSGNRLAPHDLVRRLFLQRPRQAASLARLSLADDDGADE